MLNFSDISFLETEDSVRAIIYRYFFKDFSKSELEYLGNFEIKDGKLSILGLDEDATAKKFMRFFGPYKRNLKYLLNGNDAVYVDQDLCLPLMGLNFLGIVDKGSEMIEIKPITNCNIDCSFCSVGEGRSSNKKTDFVIDIEYLIAETKKILDFKETNNISLWINPHGEPLLYDKISEYCQEMLKDKRVKDIHIVTNATLLTKSIVDSLSSARNQKEIFLSVSLSSFSEDSSKKLMGPSYNLGLVKKNLEYAKDFLHVEITPVWINGMNDKDIREIVNFAKEKKFKISIQKFCCNKNGRNPTKEIEWDEFFDKLNNLGKDESLQLIEKLEKIRETKQLPEIAKKGDKVEVEIICKGRKNDFIGVIEKNNEKLACSVQDYSSGKKRIKSVVLKSKNNIVSTKVI